MKDKIVHKSEGVIYLILTLIILLYIFFQIIDLVLQFGYAISIYDFGNPQVVDHKIFATVVIIFFNILISLEIMETFKEHKNHVLYKAKIIILIAIVAMTRKILTIDLKHFDYLMDLGIAALILSLTIGYYFISKVKADD